MTDALGWRLKLGVLMPSTNTIVQPEFDAMRPPGVTNHVARIHIPDDPIEGDAGFEALLRRVREELMHAIDRVVTCRPDALVMGMSSESLWGGAEAARALAAEMAARAGVPVATGADAVPAALARYGDVRRIAVITPYPPAADAQVRSFLEECGFAVAAIEGLRCASPTLIAHVTERELADAVDRVDGRDVEAIVQMGTNLAMARLAAELERRLDKPVIAVNTATYWWALRENGIDDRVEGFGSLLAEH